MTDEELLLEQRKVKALEKISNSCKMKFLDETKRQME